MSARTAAFKAVVDNALQGAAATGAVDAGGLGLGLDGDDLGSGSSAQHNRLSLRGFTELLGRLALRCMGEYARSDDTPRQRVLVLLDILNCSGGRDKLLKRVSELESALTAAQHGEKCHPPAWPVRLLRLFRARLLWVAWHSQGRETGSLGAQPLPRLIERTYSLPSMPLTPLLLNYPGGTQGDGGPARAQQRPTSAVA